MRIRRGSVVGFVGSKFDSTCLTFPPPPFPIKRMKKGVLMIREGVDGEAITISACGRLFKGSVKVWTVPVKITVTCFVVLE